MLDTSLIIVWISVLDKMPQTLSRYQWNLYLFIHQCLTPRYSIYQQVPCSAGVQCILMSVPAGILYSATRRLYSSINCCSHSLSCGNVTSPDGSRFLSIHCLDMSIVFCSESFIYIVRSSRSGLQYHAAILWRRDVSRTPEPPPTCRRIWYQ